MRFLQRICSFRSFLSHFPSCNQRFCAAFGSFRSFFIINIMAFSSFFFSVCFVLLSFHSGTCNERPCWFEPFHLQNSHADLPLTCVPQRVLSLLSAVASRAPCFFFVLLLLLVIFCFVSSIYCVHSLIHVWMCAVSTSFPSMLQWVSALILRSSLHAQAPHSLPLLRSSIPIHLCRFRHWVRTAFLQIGTACEFRCQTFAVCCYVLCAMLANKNKHGAFPARCRKNH